MDTRRIRTLSGAAATLAAVTVLAGCGSNLAGAPQPGEIDVRKLDVGSYNTTPLDLRYKYNHSLGSGKQLAVMRLADHVAVGPDIDPRMKYGTGSKVIFEKDQAIDLLADRNGPVVEKYNMMFGYANGAAEKQPDKSGKTPKDSAFTTVLVMQFPDPESAKQAATEIEETDFQIAADMNKRVPLAKYPDAKTHLRPNVATIGSTMARGNYVINLYLGLPNPDEAALKDLAQKAYDAQVPLLDQLKPLDPEGILRLGYDPDGMLKRTLNPDGFGSPNFTSQATLGPRGYLSLIGEQEYWQRLLNEVGMDRYSRSSAGGSTNSLFRTRDAAAAGTLLNKILERTHPGAADAPAKVPDAKCGEQTSSDSKRQRFRCAVKYRQYVAMVESNQLQDAHQRAAAQYAVLANSQL